MRALVTGAAGFVGSHLIKKLRREHYDVIGIDSFTNYYEIGLKRHNAEAAEIAGASIVDGDLNLIDLNTLLKDVDIVFHLAGQPGVRASWGSEFSEYTKANVDATQRLLEACRRSPRLRRIVYASSSSVYGEAERYPTKETDRPQPLSPYGVTKLAAEHLCGLYAANFGLPTVSLRYFTVYGPRQRPDMAFTRFAKACVTGEYISIYGTGEQVRDFTFVDDVVQANFLASNQQVAPGSVFNVAGGSHASVNEVLSIFRDVSDRNISVRYIDAIPGDVSMTGGDTTAIRSALGWQPVVSLRDGIDQQFAWMSGLMS